MTVLGIDPGKSGALAWMSPENRLGQTEGVVRRSKLTDADWIHAIATHAKGSDLVVIERTASSPQMGVKSAHTFGEERGMIRCACLLSGTRLIEVTPAKWQRAIGIPAIKKEPQPQHKRRLKQKAQELFPGMKITNDTADALLLGFYALTIELPRLRGESA